MIVLRLSGGMGNQMFQYAAAKNLAIYNDVELILDLSDLQKQVESNVYTLREFALNHFQIKNALIQSNEFDFLYKKQTNFLTGFYTHIKKKIKRYNYYFDYSLAFNPEFFKQGKNTYLEGYFQSEKYFLNIRKELLTDFCIAPNKLNVALSEKILKTESAAIHFRRGDFSDKQTVNERHGTCSIEYYKKSIRLIQEKTNKPTVFFVFSDDLSWAREQLKKLDGDFVFVESAGTQAYINDFALMKMCKHQIIANSTFSWWAAWLNENKNKIVIAPEKWLNDKSLDTSDLIPELWIKL